MTASSRKSRTRRISKADSVYEVLRDRILDWTLKPGDLINKQEICDELEVSRFPVSSAIDRLAFEGLIDIMPQHGSFVSRLRVSDLENRFTLLVAIDAEATFRVAQSGGRELIQALEQNIREAEQFVASDAEDSTVRFIALDKQFHQMILGSLDLIEVQVTRERSCIHLERLRTLICPNPEWRKQALQGHKFILRAIAAGNPQAAHLAMREHLLDAHREFRNVVREHPELFSDTEKNMRIGVSEIGSAAPIIGRIG